MRRLVLLSFIVVESVICDTSPKSNCLSSFRDVAATITRNASVQEAADRFFSKIFSEESCLASLKACSVKPCTSFVDHERRIPSARTSITNTQTEMKKSRVREDFLIMRQHVER